MSFQKLFIVCALFTSLSAFSDVSNTTLQRGGGNFGIGLSSYGGANAMGTPALSGQIEFGPIHSLQVLLGVTHSDPFEFGFGGIYRFKLYGTHRLGFHFGAGFNLGTIGSTTVTTTPVVTTSSTTFFMNFLLPIIGMSFDLGGDKTNIKLMFDGGAIMHVTPSPFQFQLAPISGLLGASIHFFL